MDLERTEKRTKTNHVRDPPRLGSLSKKNERDLTLLSAHTSKRCLRVYLEFKFLHDFVPRLALKRQLKNFISADLGKQN